MPLSYSDVTKSSDIWNNINSATKCIINSTTEFRELKQSQKSTTTKNVISRLASIPNSTTTKNIISRRASVPNSKQNAISILDFINVRCPKSAKSARRQLYPSAVQVLDSNPPDQKRSTVCPQRVVLPVIKTTANRQTSRTAHDITSSSIIATKQRQRPLRPCQKQHVGTAIQFLEYLNSPQNGFRVSFGITAPKLPQQRTHQRHAYRAQNTIIDSRKVVIEVHQQHQYTAVNSGASSHFYPTKYKGEQHDLTTDPIRVGCANKVIMVSLAEDIFYFNKLPLSKEVSQVTTIICAAIMPKQTHSNIQRRNS